MPISRRSFAVWLSSALPLAVVTRHAHALSVDAISHEPAPGRTLAALGATVLPTELGAAGVTRVVNAFQRWIAGYREHAEIVHGYGTSHIRYTGATPATRWATQLDALDASARAATLGLGFADLSDTERTALVRKTLSAERIDRMPAVSEASHVAIALLAFFYDSPEATDLCYEAQIAPQTCRPLSRSTQKPLSIQGRSARTRGA